MMPNITIAHGWHDDNKGDSAIVISTLRLLQKRFDHVVFNLIPEHWLSSDQEMNQAYRHTISAIGQINIAPGMSPLFTYHSVSHRYASAIAYLAAFCVNVIRKFPSADKARMFISQSHLVISKGGHFFYVNKSNPIQWARLYRLLYPLLLCQEYKVPYVIWGQSLGPFVDRVSTWLTANILSNAELVGVRESISRDIALKMGVPAQKVRMIPDPAFGIRPCISDRVRQVMSDSHLVPHDFIAVTVRKIGSSEERLHCYLDAIAEVARRLVRKRFAKHIAVVVHTMGPTDSENDLGPSRMLVERLRDAPVSFVTADLSPEELCGLYGQSKLVLGTRFHSVILALAAGTPAYAISYFGPKAIGIMKDFGMHEWVSSIESVRADSIVDRVLAEDLDRKRIWIMKRVQEWREKLEQETDLLVSLVRGGS